MLQHKLNFSVWVSIALAGLAHAHIAAFTWGMYCVNGTDPTANPLNNNAPVQPLYNLTYSNFWMHHANGCDDLPPDPGAFLELQAGGNFTVELAGNRAETTLNPLAKLTDWGDGLNHPDNYTGNPCITSPNLHTQNQSMASGTAWGISYQSDIKKVTPQNLVVISVLAETPWKRVAHYQVPSGLPQCPPEGCICTWLWIPNGCGIPNMYMFPYRCKVIPDSTPPRTIGNPQPPVWCEDDQSKCVKGPKQMLIWHQLDSNNIEVEGYDLSGRPKSPGYNMKCGFQNGAQYDVFVDPSSTQSVASSTIGSGTQVLAASTPTSSSPSAGSGTPASLSLTSSPTVVSGTPTDPNLSSTPTTTNPPAGSGAPPEPNPPGTSTLSGTPTITNPPTASPSASDPDSCGDPTDPDPKQSDTPTGSNTSGMPTDTNLAPGSGTPTLSGTPTPSDIPSNTSLPSGFSAPPDPNLSGTPSNTNLPSGSGTPDGFNLAGTPTDSNLSGTPTFTNPPSGSGLLPNPSLSGTPTSTNLPSGSGAFPDPNPSGIPTNTYLPSGLSDPPAGSGTPTDPNLASLSHTCTWSHQYTHSAEPSGHFKRMRMRRESHGIY